MRNEPVIPEVEAKVVVRPLSCQECRRPWHNHRERWRLYVASFDPPHLVSYCPQCARREFG